MNIETRIIGYAKIDFARPEIGVEYVIKFMNEEGKRKPVYGVYVGYGRRHVFIRATSLDNVFTYTSMDCRVAWDKQAMVHYIPATRKSDGLTGTEKDIALRLIKDAKKDE